MRRSGFSSGAVDGRQTIQDTVKEGVGSEKELIPNPIQRDSSQHPRSTLNSP